MLPAQFGAWDRLSTHVYVKMYAMKTCTRCEIPLPLSEYWRTKNSRDGLQHWCKGCHRDVRRVNREKLGSRPPRDDGSKRCSRCKIEKPRTEFAKSHTQPDGRDWYCKPCKVEQSRVQRAADPDRARQWGRANTLRSKGLTPAGYDALNLAQGGLCAGCGDAPSGRSLHLEVDHDHACCDSSKSCGSCVRGLLCRRCNAVLGLVGDDQEVLLGLVGYLSRTAVRKTA